MNSNERSARFYRLVEKLILPLTVAALIFIANNVANRIAEGQLELAKQSEQSAAANRRTELELKYIDLFFDRILSEDSRVREAALSLLFFINEREAVRLADWVASSDSFNDELRQSAVEIAEQIQGLRPIELDTSYRHDRFGTEPKDVYRRLRGFEVSFDGYDDDTGDGESDIWRVPHFVTAESRKIDSSDPPEDLSRPNRFLVDQELNTEGLAPEDTDYRGSGFDRGHLMSPRLIERLGPNAYQNAQSMINIAPQVPKLNRFAWNDLEKKTLEWVEIYGRLWIIVGPIFNKSGPQNWINEESPIAVPDAFFKVIVKEGSEPETIDVLAFIYPNDDQQLIERDPVNFLTSVGNIQNQARLQFFTRMPEDKRSAILIRQATELWN